MTDYQFYCGFIVIACSLYALQISLLREYSGSKVNSVGIFVVVFMAFSLNSICGFTRNQWDKGFSLKKRHFT